jgi:hypothetical protein
MHAALRLAMFKRYHDESHVTARRACDVDDNAQSITGFVQGSNATNAATSGAKRPAFFRTRKLARMTAAF